MRSSSRAPDSMPAPVLLMIRTRGNAGESRERASSRFMKAKYFVYRRVDQDASDEFRHVFTLTISQT